MSQINEARPHVLLVGMGNPIQERWIDRHRKAFASQYAWGPADYLTIGRGICDVPLAAVRRLGYEWAQLLLQQPHKWRRMY